jgi:hypothetical protein
MNKTDKLVAAALETEFRHYRNSELQHIKAVNDGEHGDLKPLPVPSKYQSSKAFKDQRLNWWRELFDKRMTLDDAAGLLLGFSQGMTWTAATVANTDKANQPLKAFALRQGVISLDLKDAFPNISGDIADWRVPSDGKYRAADLIAWAKEKDFVADEVLAAWEAYQAETKKPQTNTDSNPVQATATPAPLAVARDCNVLPTFIHSTKTRRDALTPVIERAQQQCNDPKDTAAVWAALQVLAEKKAAPLIGATEDGLQYLKNGGAAILNRDALRKRLGR